MTELFDFISKRLGVGYLPVAGLAWVFSIGNGNSQSIVISEFMASNQTSVEDEDGDDEDWIEIYNSGSTDVNLGGWHLTDDAGDLTRWTFPEITLAPGANLLVFASNKNRRIPGSPLHTNFKLSTSGEYLAIVRPDGVSVEHDYGPAYPLQVTDVSYGLKQETSPLTVLPVGVDSRFLVPESGEDDVKDGANVDSWITEGFDDSSWTAGLSGHGYALRANDPYDPFINTDLESAMWNAQTSVYIRIPFTVEDPTGLTNLRLRMNNDDGFVAYLNGNPEPIAELNSPPANQLAFDSAATGSNSDSNALEGAEFPVDASLLNRGPNLLCLHGLNRTSANSDALFVGSLEGAVVTGSMVEAYFQSPTPGEPNTPGEDVPGPLVRSVTNEFPPIEPSDDRLVIEANVIGTLNPLSSVELVWRIMYSPESTLPMMDDGTGEDRVAGDGIYTGVVPVNEVAEGQMVRWKVVATDDQSVSSTAPAFPDRRDSPEYYGTIARDPSVEDSKLPVLHWFTASPSGSETVSGARGSIYYLGEFYDNIQADRHGQSTGGFNKKSFDIDFNKGDRFLPYEGGNRAKDINLLTNWGDKSKTRNTLGYEIMRKAGHPAHYAFPVRVQQNARFFSTADLVEDGDDRYLERAGLDGDGALYKMYNRLDSANSGINKKTRKDENNADLAALIAGLGQSGDARLRYGYDNMNIPETINYLAAIDMTNNRDHGHKNYYLYRDTNGTGEWTPLVWDIDLCLGRNWRSGPAYFDDVFTNNNLRAGPTNRMKQFVFNDPVLNNMYRRRVRTLMDEILGEPAAPLDYLSNRVNELVSLMDPGDDNPLTGSDDADLDYQKWGSWGNRNAMRPAVDRIQNEFIPTRRNQLYRLGEIPPRQSSAVSIEIDTVEFNPASSGASPDQSGEYLVLKNPNNFAVDCTDWTISGGISMTLPAGAVIPAGGVLHVARDSVGFRNRSLSPKANEKRYVVGGYAGQLSARGETLVLKNKDGGTVQTLTFDGSPTPAQAGLRITEILFKPSGPTAAEWASNPNLRASDFEFVELTNTGESAIDLEGARFIDGISMVFGSGAVLQPGDYLLVVSNREAFELRYGDGLPVAGEFEGNLDNGGEDLQILDGAGENVLEFSYNDNWYPQTDQEGHSLVLLDESNTPVTDFDLSTSWGVSLTPGGDPGVGSPVTALTYETWKSGFFTLLELENPLIVGDQVDLDGDGRGTFEEYAFGSNPKMADPSPAYQASPMRVNEVDYLVLDYRRQKAAIDLVYEVETSSDMEIWATQANRVGEPVDLGNGIERVLIRDDVPVGFGKHRFIRLRAYLPGR